MPRSKAKQKVVAPARAPRASWQGMLRFGLVAFPVQAYATAAPEGSRIAFHQLHRDCHSRIRYVKQCPIHGPVTKDEIVSGFEYSKGQYVEIESAELDELRTERERAVTIDNFIDPDELDAVYLDGRSYYLAPDGTDAGEPYRVFLQALTRKKRYGIGQFVMSGREQVVLVRPYESVLTMELLRYASEVRKPTDLVGAIPAIRLLDKKLRLAEQVIEEWADERFDYAAYVDHYQNKVRDLIEAKVDGKELVTPAAEDKPELVNLMDALRRSVHRRSASGVTARRGSKSRRSTTTRHRTKGRKAS